MHWKRDSQGKERERHLRASGKFVKQMSFDYNLEGSIRFGHVELGVKRIIDAGVGLSKGTDEGKAWYFFGLLEGV